jgi:hypothetical protein
LSAAGDRNPLWLIGLVAVLAVANMAAYKDVLRVMGTGPGLAFLAAGTVFVIWCVWFLERRA